MSRFRRPTSAWARLAQLEAAGERRRRAQAARPMQATCPLTAQQRTDGLRRVLRCVRWPDPFPDREGAEYLEQFWSWWLQRETAEATASFPTWARDALSRLCAMPDDLRVAKLRELLREIGWRDPFPRLRGRHYLEAYRRWRRVDARHQRIVPPAARGVVGGGLPQPERPKEAAIQENGQALPDGQVRTGLPPVHIG